MYKQSVFPALALAAGVLAVLAPGAARAEVDEIHIAKQYGISYLPLMMMEDQKLVEKQAKALGQPGLKVQWSTFAGGNVMNDALLSSSLEFASGGVGPFLTLWAKTRGNYNVQGVTAMNSMPLYLVSSNPKVKTIKDLAAGDKIALPAVKVSIQAVTLQMAAEQAFGAGEQYKLDSMTVTMSHPDGQAALLSGSSEVTGHFTAPPFQYSELKDPRVHQVLSSYDVLGGASTFNVVWTTAKFRNDNPKVYQAFVAAFNEAIKQINDNKQAAAEAYLRISGDKRSSVADIMEMMNDPKIVFTTTPQNVMKYADFMQKIGSIKVKPASWKDLFFPNMHNQSGS